EIDYTDAPFVIQRPVLTPVQVRVDSTFAYTSRDTVITLNLCNTGQVPAIVTGAYLAQSVHVRLVNMTLPDTVMPGACLRLPLRVTPADTGLLRDEVKVQLCATTATLPLSVYSIPRNLGPKDTVDIGDRCPLAELDTVITVVTNRDPVPIVIDESFLSDQTDSWFTVVSAPRNDTLLPGESYRVRIRFSPSKVGSQTKVLLVFYGSQRRLYARVVLKGRGIGSALTVKPSVVGFIPEQRERTVTIINTNTNEVTLASLAVVPTSAFRFDPVSLPRVIAPGDSLAVKVYWDDTTVTEGSLQAAVAPCSAPVNIGLRRYSGSATLRLPKIAVDPRGRARIPVSVKIAENFTFGGVRALEAEFTVNPRMFLADSVQAVLGSAAIVRQEIDNDLRSITLRMQADFPYADTVVAIVHGFAGLAETDVSPLTWNRQSVFFGSSVRVTTGDGELRLSNLCGTRRVVQSGGVRITSVDPQPAENDVTVSFSCDDAGPVACEVHSAAGERVHVQHGMAVQGTNTLR
ncbi:MAG: hypothetical protein ACKOAG_04685, partial [Candidatus Kapaibacterium sp.]